MQMYLFEAMRARERDKKYKKNERGMNIKKRREMCRCPI
jgi:hypothetical protein